MKALAASLAFMLFVFFLGTSFAQAPATARVAHTSATLATGKPAGVIAPGTRYATPYYIQSGAAPGPLVVILGGVHGDEPSGRTSAELIRHWTIARGKMVVIPRANVPGIEANTRNIPKVESALANLNRNFPRTGKNEAPRGELATALWQQIKSFKPDWVVDLHEGFGFHIQTTSTVGSSVITVKTPECLRISEKLLAAVNATVQNPQRKFVQLAIPADGTLAGAVGEHLKVQAMIIETTSGGGQPLALRTRQHRLMVATLLRELKMINGPAPIE